MKDFYNKYKKKITKLAVIIIFILLLWFLVLSPFIKFKSNENKMLAAAKRYFEINSRDLPTGSRIKTITLQRLYDKDLIDKDLTSSYMSKLCDTSSWIKVKKVNNEYKYYSYLKCGVLSSNVDHDGPKITLKGQDIVTLSKGDEYKEPGISSVIDNTDGNIDTKKVTIDSKELDVNKNGRYKIYYKIRDSFGNQTIKERIVNVVQILDKIVEKDTKKTNGYYQNDLNAKYIRLDGIKFRVVGLNKDNTVKVVSDEALTFVDYDGADKWLNDYFYNKFSDSAKKYIVKSKFCNESITDYTNYKTCNKYSNKKNVGLLSVSDINNMSSNEQIEISGNNLLANKNDDKIVYYKNSEFKTGNKNNTYSIMPVVSIKKDSYISHGSGDYTDPYILKGNSIKLKAGSNINEAKVGSYVRYSGYNFRVIEKDEETTKIIMDELLQNQESISFSEKDSYKFNPKEKNNIGYYLNNGATQYIKTDLFVSKNIKVNSYTKKLKYNKPSKTKNYKMKLSLPSVYDLFSASVRGDYWYSDNISSSKKYCYYNYTYPVIECSKYDSNDQKDIRVVAYLNKNVSVKSGSGEESDPFVVVK